MMRKLLLSVMLLLLVPVCLRAQNEVCSARITVVDSLLVTDNVDGLDSVRYLLRAPEGTDSLHWYPDSLFLNPEADSQWVTLCCRDTLRVRLTAWYDTVNLLRWTEPGYLQRHTTYTFVPSPTEGDLCQPRSVAVDSNASRYCRTMADYSIKGVIVRCDTAAPADRMDTLTSIPQNGTYHPLYIDTVDIDDSSRSYTFIYQSVRLDHNVNTSFYHPWHLLEAVYPDTTLIFNHDPVWADVMLNYWTLPAGKNVILRFYEKSSAQRQTIDAFQIYTPRLLGGCVVSDSLLLVGPDCNCSPVDTVDAYVCESQLPYTWDSLTFEGEGIDSLLHPGHYCDTTRVYRLHVIPNSDTSVYDTVMERQLPWSFLDTLFTDTASNCPIRLPNEAGCDSTIYYNLHVFWDGDHCDSMLHFPNAVTANGDGINDRFVISGLVENACYPYNLLIIYDRTGRAVYRAENITRDDQFWDPAAARMPSGTYFYFFQGHGVEIQTRHVGVIEVLR